MYGWLCTTPNLLLMLDTSVEPNTLCVNPTKFLLLSTVSVLCHKHSLFLSLFCHLWNMPRLPMIIYGGNKSWLFISDILEYCVFYGVKFQKFVIPTVLAMSWNSSVNTQLHKRVVLFCISYFKLALLQ